MAVAAAYAALRREFITPADGKEWRLRLNPSTWITFQEDDQGRVLSYTAHVPGKGAFVRPRVGGE